MYAGRPPASGCVRTALANPSLCRVGRSVTEDVSRPGGANGPDCSYGCGVWVWVWRARRILLLMQHLKIQTWTGPDTEVHTEVIDSVRDWGQWLQGLGVDLAGGLKGDETAHHAYLFFRRAGPGTNV